MDWKRRLGMPLLGAVITALLAMGGEVRAERVTYAKDVAPIIQSNCQECHRPGEAVPMPLTSYEQVRPWAKSLQEAVVSRTMPPWHADPSIGEFSNERRLTEEEIDTFVAWAEQGAPMGNPADLPEPVEYTEGWKIGEPDMIFEMAKPVHLAADLVDEYKYVMIPTNLTEDRWVEAAECRPGNVEVVHHIIAFIREAGSGERGGLGASLGGYAPGLEPAVLPPGEALYLPAGSTLVLQMHYNKEAGLEATDDSKIGVRFAREPVTKRLRMGAAGNRTFAIPPYEENHEVNAVEVIQEDMHMQSITPHMHLRGKNMKVWAELPDGSVKDLVWVPNYDFDWQTSYRFAEPVALPAGTKVHAKAFFDNSENNPYNPDPSAEVRWGLPTYTEMMFAFYSYTLDDEQLNEMDPAARVLASGESATSGGE